MSDSSSPAPTAAASAQPQQQQPRLVFFMPPPVTFTMQFGGDGGPTLQFIPSPMGFLGDGLNFWTGMQHQMESDGMMRALHELFVRNQQEAQGPPPTSKSFLDKMPTKCWTASSSQTEKFADCPICLCDYELKDEFIALPCSHMMHKDCGMPWLTEHNVCPVCRHQLPTAQDEAAAKPAAASAPVSEPEQELEPEPENDDDESVRVTGLRRSRSQSLDQPRLVRQRVHEHENTTTLPGSLPSLDEDEMESLLEEEATRLVEEELAKRTAHDDGSVNFDEVDVEELLRESSTW